MNNLINTYLPVEMTVKISEELTVAVVFHYEPEELANWDEPGCDESFEFISVRSVIHCGDQKLFGPDISEYLSEEAFDKIKAAIHSSVQETDYEV